MTDLHLKRPLACPLAQAPVHLERFFAEHVQGDAAVVALRAPIALPGLPKMLTERDCVISLVRTHPPGSMDARYDVSWESAGGGPFPHFKGTLAVPCDEDYNACWLSLDGSYEPPLGAPGAAFDAILGKHIAESTGKDLLEQIGTYVEQSYRSVETAKANRRAAPQ